jgi:hypothetical protein
MTEKEWLECDDPHPMVELLTRVLTRRKSRFFVIASLRDASKQLTINSIDVFAAAEHYADEIASDEEIFILQSRLSHFMPARASTGINPANH